MLGVVLCALAASQRCFQLHSGYLCAAAPSHAASLSAVSDSCVGERRAARPRKRQRLAVRRTEDKRRLDQLLRETARERVCAGVRGTSSSPHPPPSHPSQQKRRALEYSIFFSVLYFSYSSSRCWEVLHLFT